MDERQRARLQNLADDYKYHLKKMIHPERSVYMEGIVDLLDEVGCLETERGHLDQQGKTLAQIVDRLETEMASMKADQEAWRVAGAVQAEEFNVERRDLEAEVEKYRSELAEWKAKSEGTYCAYCGERFPLDGQAAEQVGEHIRTCPKHPMRQIEAQRNELRDRRDTALAALERETLQHAACLSIAEGAPGWDAEKLYGYENSQAIRAVQALRREVETLRGEVAAHLEDYVRQECYTDTAGEYDSSAISTRARAMRRLADLGRFVITEEGGCRVIGHFPERSEEDGRKE